MKNVFPPSMRLDSPTTSSMVNKSPLFGAVLPRYQDFTDESTTADYWSNKHASYRGPPRSKVVCTIGPASESPERLREMFAAGMNVACMDLSIFPTQTYAKIVREVRKMEHQERKLCAVMWQTLGPEIRSGALKEGVKNVQLKKDQEFVLHTDKDTLGDETQVSVRYAQFASVVKPGHTILVEKGGVQLTVQRVENGRVVCKVENDGKLGSKMRLSVPGEVLESIPSITQRDTTDIQFGVNLGVDFISAFVRSAKDVRTIRAIINNCNSKQPIQILAKIESQEGLKNFDEILEEADGVFIARADLGVDIDLSLVPIAQKLMIRKCNAAGKVVITSQQMLKSMCSNPTPTRAEATDVENAIFDGSDAVVLTSETAFGKYPIESVQMMADICRESEKFINYQATFSSIHERALESANGEISVTESLASSAVKTCIDLKAAVIVVLSFSGNTARLVSKYRPSAPILMLTESETVARQALASRGVIPLLVASVTGTQSLVKRAIKLAGDLGIAELHDNAVVIAGSAPGSASLSGAASPSYRDDLDDVNIVRVMKVEH